MIDTVYQILADEDVLLATRTMSYALINVRVLNADQVNHLLGDRP